MIKKGTEKKPRTKKKSENTLSASSETNSEVDIKTLLAQIIHFGTPFKCRTKTQKTFLNLIYEKATVFATGPGGVGKTYVAVAAALDLLKTKETPYSKIIISKPIVEVDEEMGFQPGNVREKMDPYIYPIIEKFDKIIGERNRIELEALGILQIMPLAFTRGRSIDNAIVIMDEAQNMSPHQMKTLLTRIENSKFLILGDLDQSDRYEDAKQSGLYNALQLHKNISEYGFVEFSDDEVVRNPLIIKLLQNYKAEADQKALKIAALRYKAVAAALPKKKESRFTKFLRFIGIK
jgi:phosphate starvation-inducible PhoH-like protein